MFSYHPSPFTAWYKFSSCRESYLHYFCFPAAKDFQAPHSCASLSTDALTLFYTLPEKHLRVCAPLLVFLLKAIINHLPFVSQLSAYFPNVFSLHFGPASFTNNASLTFSCLVVMKRFRLKNPNKIKNTAAGLLTGLPGPEMAQSFRFITPPTKAAQCYRAPNQLRCQHRHASHVVNSNYQFLLSPSANPLFSTSTDICGEDFMPPPSHRLSLSLVRDRQPPPKLLSSAPL
ncbi:hypothetical protein GOODEAATRI_008687 [Goodea atripinnis]|uniref:Uncharacterized protein n=1 Tax=Goodea atripinnis TaxID=208336 RepID=A0ABV0NIN8_9TELE